MKGAKIGGQVLAYYQNRENLFTVSVNSEGVSGE